MSVADTATFAASTSAASRRSVYEIASSTVAVRLFNTTEYNAQEQNRDNAAHKQENTNKPLHEYLIHIYGRY